ncbi:MAG: proline--tRNA ligase [Deltaproteobacteria bacterium]|nr:proline--tRNA ligase [Deltaproteobacteria bacterium]
MRYSQLFLRTLHEPPRDAEVISHKLLSRAGCIQSFAAGVYALLPLGNRVADKIVGIIRQEMDRIGGNELTMPVINPADLWKETGRYQVIGPELIRFRDRNNREFVLAMTNEETVTDIARKAIRSYRDLPFMLYQIQTKVRDEPRPRGGIIRLREFLMKDGYSFHADFEDLDAYYPSIYEAYLRIFRRCGLNVHDIEADSGIMGGSGSHEFMLECANGEDRFVFCPVCGYRANTDKAVAIKPRIEVDTGDQHPMEKVPTPGVKTISALMEFFGTSTEHFLKTVAYMADGELVMAIVRGDFDVSETKLTNYLRCTRLELAPEDELIRRGLHAGFLSPIGIEGVRVVMDTSVEDAGYLVAGGNEVDTHYQNVLYGRDFSAGDIQDIAVVRNGDRCLQCSNGRLELRPGIELGHTFKLGTKYTDESSMDVTYLDREGRQKRVVMGCYGVGVERLMAAVVEQWHDESGIIWPASIAPFQAYLMVIGKSEHEVAVGDELYEELSGRFEVLYDDREESPGFKFKDADLIGIPLRILVSERLLKQGCIEIKVRQSGQVFNVSRTEIEPRVKALLDELTPRP